MRAQISTSPDPIRLGLTEAALASADRLWRKEMRRAFGPEAVLTYGYAKDIIISDPDGRTLSVSALETLVGDAVATAHPHPISSA